MAERPSRQRSTRSSRVTLLGDDDLHYFNEGTHYQLYEKLGAHLVTAGRTKGFRGLGSERCVCVCDRRF